MLRTGAPVACLPPATGGSGRPARQAAGRAGPRPTAPRPAGTRLLPRRSAAIPVLAAAALLLCAPGRAADPAAAWQATVTELTGLVRSHAADTTVWTPVSPGAVLQPGDTLATLATGRVRIEFSDGSRVHLGPDTRLVVAPPREGRRRVSLLRGFARFIAAKLGSGADELTVVTPTAIAAVKGTEFSLNVGDGVTDIAVFEGEVLCADRERRYAVLMRAGETARWDRNGMWEPPRRMGDDERAAPADAGAVPPPPGGVRLGGYLITEYRHSDAGGNGFVNPWMSVQAVSPLGDRAQAFWELWIQGIGGGPRTGGWHGRLDLLQAWAELDAVRSASGPAPLALRAGILNMPVGLLSRSHELPRRVFTSFPVFAVWMVPVPWRDLGVQATSGWTGALGTVRLEVAAVNGLQIEPADPVLAPLVTFEGMWWARPTEPGRSFNHDNNGSPATTGRLGWSAGPVALGASGYRGRMDTGGDFTLSMLLADLTVAGPAAGIRWALTSEAGVVSLPDPLGTLGGPRAGGYVELTAEPEGWPVSLGLGYSPMYRRRPKRSHKMHDDVQVAVSWRPVDRIVVKLAGEYHQSDFPGIPTIRHRDLIAQVAAQW